MVSLGCKGFQEVRGLGRVTRGYMKKHCITTGYRGFKGVTRAYKRLQGITRGYRGF